MPSCHGSGKRMQAGLGTVTTHPVPCVPEPGPGMRGAGYAATTCGAVDPGKVATAAIADTVGRHEGQKVLDNSYNELA